MTRSDWLLLALAAADGNPVSPVQIQKSLFLIGKNLSPDAFYDFEPYDYGPFCVDIYSDAEVLRGEGLIDVSRGGRVRQFAATEDGLSAARKLNAAKNEATLKFVRETLAWVRSLAFDDLVRAIYKKYPETKVNSIFRG